MRALLRGGADVNQKGINDWTPLHHAGTQNDLEALKLFKEYGADFTIRTRIDEYATPYEEAISCNANKDILNWFRENAPF